MSIASFLDSNKNFDTDIVRVDQSITNSLVVTNGTNSVSHSVDQNGNYNVVDENSNNLIKFRTGSLQSGCALHTHIANQVTPLTRAITNTNTTVAGHASALAEHDTRLDNIEGGSSGLQSLNSVLAVGSDANNQDITNLKAVGCVSLTASGNVTGVNITTINNTLTDHTSRIESLEAIPMLPTISLGYVLENSNNAQGSDIIGVRNLTCNGDVSSTNITVMQNVVNSYQTAIQQLQDYNTELKKLISSISQSLDLKDPSNSSNDFDYSSLLE